MGATNRLLLILVCFFGYVKNIWAQVLAKGKTRVTTVFNLYHQNSEEGKQVIDNSGREEVNVLEPMVFVSHQFDENTNIHSHFVFDAWTAASDTRLDANTGASGGEGIKNQSRFSGGIGVSREHDVWTYGVDLGVSTEYDYKSLNGTITVAA